MNSRSLTTALALTTALGLAGQAAAQLQAPMAALNPCSVRSAPMQMTRIGSYETGILASDAVSSVAWHPKSSSILFVDIETASVKALDISDPTAPTLRWSIGSAELGGSPFDVDSEKDAIAVAVHGTPATSPGRVVFLDQDGGILSSVQVGAAPGDLAFTRDGKRLLVANEGMPSDNYAIDPEGSLSLIEVRRKGRGVSQAHVQQIGFTQFNALPVEPGVRIFGLNASVAQDLEPESLTISDDGVTAWVTLQENNAVAVVDLQVPEVVRVAGLGFKDHSLPSNALDPSDMDGGIAIANWPVYGMYQPEGIGVYRSKGRDYVVTANEGDARGYTALNEEVRVSSAAVVLDHVAFPPPSSFWKNSARLGRLGVTALLGDTDMDMDFDELYAFGARSFSIWTADVEQTHDSGDEYEQIVAAVDPAHFNASDDATTPDSRSDNKGPEPEPVALATFHGRDYAFVGLERVGGMMVHDITDPYAPCFVDWFQFRDWSGPVSGDVGPQDLLFIDKSGSPNRQHLLVAANSASGNLSIYRIDEPR